LAAWLDDARAVIDIDLADALTRSTDVRRCATGPRFVTDRWPWPRPTLRASAGTSVADPRSRAASDA